MYNKALKNNEKIFSIAPMMDWTDRHCRYFHRLLTKRALLYSEMVVADALIHGDVARHLNYSDVEHPIALQLGGSDPVKLAKAAGIASDWNYDEINLNVGCPSDRVQSGTFGACLMREPSLVANCVDAIKAVVDVPVTVKCRIGVDEQEPEIALFDMAEAVFANGCDALWVHARKAWLQGLSPKENRDVPPLDYDIVGQLKQEYPDKFIGINGGLKTLEDAQSVLAQSTGEGREVVLDGAMVGRAAYQSPALLMQVDALFYDSQEPTIDIDGVCREMMSYTADHLKSGGRVNHVTRHMIGLFQGQPGARRYRQILSVDASKPDADERLIERAFDAVLKDEQYAA